MSTTTHTSRSSIVVAPGTSFRCGNPHCPKGKHHVFLSSRAFTMHLKNSQSCSALRYNTKNNEEDSESFSPCLQVDTESETESNDGTTPAINLLDDFPDNSALAQSPSDDSLEFHARKKLRPNFVVTSQQRSMVKLIKLLDDMNCPDYALPKILEWALENERNQVSFQSAVLNRDSNVSWMRKMLHNANCLLPKVIPTSLSSSINVDVMCFDFVPQLLSLLQDPDKMTAENLVIDIDWPVVNHYIKPEQRISEVYHGSAYKEAFKNAIKARNEQGGFRSLFVVPICLWGDATHIDQHGKFKLEPWSFSPLIFNEKARRNPDFWKVLGYVNVLKLTKAEKKKLKKGVTCQMYHKQLEVIFAHLKESSKRLKNITLPIGRNRNINVDIVCPVLYVIADTEGADKMCGRYICYSRPISRRCRVCDVSEEGFSNPEASYTIADSVQLTQTQSSGDKEMCSLSSVHHVNNAFRQLDMGGSSNGIFTATPPDVLHVVRKGLMERLAHCILEQFSSSELATLDKMAIHYHLSQKQRCKADYPKMAFTCGFTNLSFVQAHEWVGILFLLVTLAQTQSGWQLFEGAFTENENCTVPDVVNLLEAVLCFDAWLHQDEFWCHNDAPQEEATATESIRMLMNLCLAYFPNEWHVIKFHMLLHFPHFITKFGAPNNYDSQRPEHSHIAHAKRPGRRAHKTHSGQKFEAQVAQRMADTFVIQCLHNTLTENDEVNCSNGCMNLKLPYEGTLCRIHCYQDNISEVWNYTQATKASDVELKLLPGLRNFLLDFYDNEDTVICTEMHANQVLYRCHPNYRGEGPFYDWAMLQTTPCYHRPCKIVAFLPVINDSNVVNQEFEETLVVVLPCARKTQSTSTLYQEWELNNDFKIFPLSAILCPCLTITLDDSKVCVALDRKDWASKFT